MVSESFQNVRHSLRSLWFAFTGNSTDAREDSFQDVDVGALRVYASISMSYVHAWCSQVSKRALDLPELE